MALITDHKIICANSGDCRTVLKQDGRVLNLSIDHKASYMPEIHRVQRAGGNLFNGRVDGRLAVTRSIGDHHYKQRKAPADADFDWYIHNQKVSVMPEVKSVDLTPETQFLVLACDGIWDCLTSPQVMSYVEKGLISNEDAIMR